MLWRYPVNSYAVCSAHLKGAHDSESDSNGGVIRI